jgi:sugar O-acyltransferase (sialic acid O-acetyltransferase NeuD family)
MSQPVAVCEVERISLPILILGARVFAREVADLLDDTPGLELKGFVENLDPERCRTLLESLPIYWVDELPSLAATHWGLCAFGTTHRAAFIQQATRHGLRFATLIHPGARVSSRSEIGEGSIVNPGVQVASHSRIGAHTLVNRGALIGHDTEIGSGVTIGPGANIAGRCRIGAGSYIGMGSIVTDRISIGEGAVVAAGSVVTRDVPDRVMVAGMPAVIVKTDVDGL